MFHVKPMLCKPLLVVKKIFPAVGEYKIKFNESSERKQNNLMPISELRKKIILILLIIINSTSCFSQKEKKISLGLSLDYGLGEKYNNYATALHLNYKITDKIRIAPYFSYYFLKNNMKMSTLALNIHYLFYPEQLSNSWSFLKNQGLCFYPIAGFIATNFTDNINCSSCSIEKNLLTSRFAFNFGINFGAGVDYKLPTLLPVFRDMIINFAVEYQVLEKYRRPIISCGIFYNF